jgi:hypothetical protein
LRRIILARAARTASARVRGLVAGTDASASFLISTFADGIIGSICVGDVGP